MLCSSRYFSLGAQDGYATFVEAPGIFLGGNFKIDGEDQVGTSEVQVNWQRHLQDKPVQVAVNGRRATQKLLGMAATPLEVANLPH